MVLLEMYWLEFYILSSGHISGTILLTIDVGEEEIYLLNYLDTHLQIRTKYSYFCCTGTINHIVITLRYCL